MKIKKDNNIIIFCDGASKGNPGPGGWGVIIIDTKKVVELGGREDHTTNNRMELSGAIGALEKIKDNKEEVEVYTDSKYLIGGMTVWIHNWQKNDWKKGKRLPNGKMTGDDVLNQDLWKKLIEVTKDKKITWHYVAGHDGNAGNERCDEIASGLALGEDIELYTGALNKYPLKIMPLGLHE